MGQRTFPRPYSYTIILPPEKLESWVGRRAPRGARGLPLSRPS